MLILLMYLAFAVGITAYIGSASKNDELPEKIFHPFKKQINP